VDADKSSVSVRVLFLGQFPVRTSRSAGVWSCLNDHATKIQGASERSWSSSPTEANLLSFLLQMNQCWHECILSSIYFPAKYIKAQIVNIGILLSEEVVLSSNEAIAAWWYPHITHSLSHSTQRSFLPHTIRRFKACTQLSLNSCQQARKTVPSSIFPIEYSLS
jgi:hypothetical protein